MSDDMMIQIAHTLAQLDRRLARLEVVEFGSGGTAGTASMTAGEILTALKTVDGTGSGLDADYLDGISSAGFLGTADASSFLGTADASSFLGTADASLFLGTADASSFVGTATYTASDVLTKVKTVDGTGSGLDADTLDGIHASSFVTGVSDYRWQSSFTSKVYDYAGGAANLLVDATGAPLDAQHHYRVRAWPENAGSAGAAVALIDCVTDGGGGHWTYRYLSRAGTTGNHPEFYGAAPAVRPSSAGSATFMVVVEDAHSYIQGGSASPFELGNFSDYLGVPMYSGGTIWTSANDGTASLLDADLLDGYQGTAYARLGTANTFTANQRVPRLEIDNASNYVDVDAAGALGWKAINVVVANAAFVVLGNIHAVLFIVDVSSGAFCIMNLRGAYNATQELLDVSGRFSVTKDTATSINIYWDAGGYYVLQNNIGATRTLTLYEMLG